MNDVRRYFLFTFKYIVFVSIAMFISGCNAQYSHNFYTQSKGQNSQRLSEINSSSQPTRSYHEMQLQAVTRTRFNKKRVLNPEEGKLFWILIKAIPDKQFHLLSQVSLGEIFKHDGDEFKYINCKRADFCYVNKNFEPFMLIEYNGSGHYLNDSHTRDEIKRVACDSAGIHYITITYHEDLQESVNRKILPLLLNNT